MRKCDIKTLIRTAAEKKKLCRVNFDYDENTYSAFPLVANDKLFLCVNENDFVLDGYSIRRFKDVKKAEYEDGKYFSILENEGLTNKFDVPNIDVSDWYSAFLSLQNLGKNIIVENEKAKENETEFVIGRIIKVTKTKVVMQHFDADGIWEEELYDMPFSKITSVSFGMRYIELFSKYLLTE